MIMDIKVTVTEGQRFSDVPELRTAKNCIIDKTVTGLGYTHWMLNHPDNTEDVIMVTPLVSIARSKVSDSVFGYIGAFHLDKFDRMANLSDYLRKNDVHKIMVTPELLTELLTLLPTDQRDYCLAIDELDLSVQHSTFRTSMPQLIDTFLSWGENRVACSATNTVAVRRAMQLLPQVKVTPTWDIVQDTNLLESKRPYGAAKARVESCLKAGGHSVFFVNNAEAILNIIQQLNLSSTDCGVLAGDSVRASVETISEKLGQGYDKTQGFDGYLSTPITFMTSAYISGADVHTPDVDVYFVSNASGQAHERWSNDQMIQGKGRFRNGIKAVSIITNFKPSLINAEYNDSELRTGAEKAIEWLKAFPVEIASPETVAVQQNNLFEQGICIRTDRKAVNEEMLISILEDQSNGYNYANMTEMMSGMTEQLSLSHSGNIDAGELKKEWTALGEFKKLFATDDDTIAANWKDILNDILDPKKEMPRQWVKLAKAINGDLVKLTIAMQARSIKQILERLCEDCDADIFRLRLLKSFEANTEVKRSDVNQLLKDLNYDLQLEMKLKDMRVVLDTLFKTTEKRKSDGWYVVFGSALGSYTLAQ